jgi:protein TonB
MFEDSTFESGGRIKTKSGRWAMFTFITNASVIVLLILIPLIYPEALPKAATSATASARGRTRGARADGDDEQSAHGSHAHSA